MLTPEPQVNKGGRPRKNKTVPVEIPATLSDQINEYAELTHIAADWIVVCAITEGLQVWATRHEEPIKYARSIRTLAISGVPKEPETQPAPARDVEDKITPGEEKTEVDHTLDGSELGERLGTEGNQATLDYAESRSGGPGETEPSDGDLNDFVDGE